MKHIFISLRMTFFLMVVLGIAYPVAVTLVAQGIFPTQANGSLIYEDGKLRGSELIGQSFESPGYFWSRPSAVGYNPMPSGGSNLGPTAQGLKDAVKERTEKLRTKNHGLSDPPQHLLFASSSGLDPHQSVAALDYQSQRVAEARGMSVGDVQKLIATHTESRQLRLFGEEVVNVLALNRALDKLKPQRPTQEPAPNESTGAQHSSDSSGN